MQNLYDYLNDDNARKYASGEIVFHEGEPANEMILILSGFLDCFVDYGEPSQTLKRTLPPGFTAAEAPMLLGVNCDCTIVSRGDSVILALNKERLIDFFWMNPDTAVAIFKNKCKELEDLTASLFSGTVKQDSQTQKKTPMHSLLFPEGHGIYELNLAQPDSDLLFEKKFKCPACGNDFKAPAVRTSKLVTDRTDSDMRVRYKDIEPMYYEVVSCPECWYSVLSDQMSGLSQPRKKAVLEMLTPYKQEILFNPGFDKVADDIFTGYFLALKCAEAAQNKPYMTYGKLWMKISRLYDDVGDEKLARYALEQTRDSYQLAFERLTIPASQNQQLCYILGYLNMRLGDLNTARKLLFEARTDSFGSKAVARMAEDLIEEMRSAEKEDRK